MWETWEEIVHGGVWKATWSSEDQPCKRVGPQQQAITVGIFGDNTCWRTAFSYLVGSPPFPPPQTPIHQIDVTEDNSQWQQLVLLLVVFTSQTPCPMAAGVCWDIIGNQSGEAINAGSPVRVHKRVYSCESTLIFSFSSSHSYLQQGVVMCCFWLGSRNQEYNKTVLG